MHGGPQHAVLWPGAAECFVQQCRQQDTGTLAALLHETLGGTWPESGMLRAAMHRYWSGSARARAASMALLAMDDVSTASILLEFLRILASGLLTSSRESSNLLHRAMLTARLSQPMMRHMLAAIRVQ